MVTAQISKDWPLNVFKLLEVLSISSKEVEAVNILVWCCCEDHPAADEQLLGDLDVSSWIRPSHCSLHTKVTLAATQITTLRRRRCAKKSSILSRQKNFVSSARGFGREPVSAARLLRYCPIIFNVLPKLGASHSLLPSKQIVLLSSISRQDLDGFMVMICTYYSISIHSCSCTYHAS